MLPALIGVALIILLVASRVAADEEQEDRGAEEDDQPQKDAWTRQMRTMAEFVVLLPVGLVLASLFALLVMGGPWWWWVWLLCALAYLAYFIAKDLRGGRGT